MNIFTDLSGQQCVNMRTNFFTRDTLRDHGNYKNFHIGEYSYGTPTVKWWGEDTHLFIGRFCSIAAGCIIFLGGNHRVDWITTYPFSAILDVFPFAKGIKGHPSTNGDVVIGNDVWIGSGVTIMSGVKVHDGAVLCANATVTKDVPPYHIVGGVPAKTVRKRFSDENINKLLSIQWWNWDIEKIERNIKFLLSNRLEDFFQAASSS